MTQTRIYLASKSPRRAQLLTSIGVLFDVLEPPQQDAVNADMVDESILANETAYDYVLRLARNKARYAFDYMQRAHIEQRIICAADTTVTIDGDILGKPADKKEAFDMMQRLSGQTHQVMTGVAVANAEQIYSLVQVSDVHFCQLSTQTIESYIATDEPYDKAGGYGIQGIAGRFISHINGSYSGIMGLPVYETAQLLTQAGLILP